MKCLKAARSLFPHASNSELHDLLWSATAFPMGGPDIVYRQLLEGIDGSDGTISGVITFAEDQFRRELDSYNETRETENSQS